MSSTLLNLLKYSVFPKRCNICGEVISFDNDICEPCSYNVRIDGETCLSCGKMKQDCTCDKSRHKPDYKAIVAPFVYDNNVPRAIHRLKFYGRQELAIPMAHQISEVIREKYKDVDFDFVTYVPMTFKRYNKRGYNQSYLLAKAVAKELNLPLCSTLKKVFNTVPQRTLPAKFRRGNVFGAYDIKTDVDFENKTILIIDDVKTTGATISHCSYLLKIYGAESVYAATFAIR